MAQQRNKRKQHRKQYVRKKHLQKAQFRQALNNQAPEKPSQVQQLLDKPTSMATNAALIIGGVILIGIGALVAKWMYNL